jgi:hypothetical protein
MTSVRVRVAAIERRVGQVDGADAWRRAWAGAERLWMLVARGDAEGIRAMLGADAPAWIVRMAEAAARGEAVPAQAFAGEPRGGRCS